MYMQYDRWLYPEQFASMRTYGMLLVGVLVGLGLLGNDCPAAAIASILYQVSHIKNN
jgi:hypothetical protein